MKAWSEGYVTDIPYTSKCYAELAPGFLAFACLRQGVRPPELAPGAAYLELGCGQGYGLNVLAASNPGISFWGVDFDPGQIDNARRLARAAALSNVVFEDFSFRQLLSLPTGRLPKFDVVVLHGVYSWVSAENRGIIVQILDQALKPGGMAYVSYNCLPGRGAMDSLQRFVAEHAARASGPATTRVTAALRAALQLAEGDAAFFRNNPQLKVQIEQALKQDPVYLVHEYLSDEVHALYHADVAGALEGARLAFAASANIADDFVNLAAPAQLQPLVREAQDPTWRETLLDFAAGTPFRRDVFVRGRTTVGALQHEAMLDETRFALLTSAQEAIFEFPVPLGQLKGQESVYRPIVEALAQGPRSYGDLRALPALAQAREGALLQAVALLVGGRQIHPLSNAAVGGAEAARRFNRIMVEQSSMGEASSHVAAPLVGAGVRLEFTELMAIGGALAGDETPDATARRAWDIMARTGRRLIRDGEVLQDQAANEAELVQRIAAFNETKLPLFHGLGVV